MRGLKQLREDCERVGGEGGIARQKGRHGEADVEREGSQAFALLPGR